MARRLAATGPDTDARTSAVPKLPNGASALPVQSLKEGRVLTMLTTPPSELRP